MTEENKKPEREPFSKEYFEEFDAFILGLAKAIGKPELGEKVLKRIHDEDAEAKK